MKRSRGIRESAKRVLAAMFLVAALASTGCGNNALLNPVNSDEVVNGGGGGAGLSGREVHPSGRETHP